MYKVAKNNGLTDKSIFLFRSSGTVTKNEIFALASQLANWADKTGGCKPQVCK